MTESFCRTVSNIATEASPRSVREFDTGLVLAKLVYMYIAMSLNILLIVLHNLEIY